MTINIMTNILHNNHDICELIFTSNTPRSDVNMQKKKSKKQSWHLTESWYPIGTKKYPNVWHA